MNGEFVYLGLDNKLGVAEPAVVRMRCPNCRHKVRLEALNTPHDQRLDLKDGREVLVGLRHCPEESCGQIVFVVVEENFGSWEIVFTAPQEALDFDSTDLPTSVLAAIQEAAVCFSNGCYVAAGIMIRKTLEEMCAERQATGGTLAERLKSLKGMVILPDALLTGIDSLRLLGNDAAHIQAKTFAEVGRDEIEVSFDVVKEVLKAVYQYDALVAKLDALKK